MDGYIKEDIKSLLKCKPTDGNSAGAAGYPLIMTVFAGVELLGSLLDAVDKPAGRFDTYSGEAYFENYWRRVLYLAAPRDAMGVPLYKVVRHGLMHAFSPKGSLCVTKGDEGRHEHLRQESDGTIYINCDELADNFLSSIEGLKSTLEKNRRRVEARLDDIAKQYTDQAREALKGVAFPSIVRHTPKRDTTSQTRAPSVPVTKSLGYSNAPFNVSISNPLTKIPK